MESIPSYLGEATALLTAMTWALAVIMFKKSGESVHPIGLNLFKSVLAIILFLPTMWLWGESLFRAAPLSDYLIVLASGAIGIAISDTLFLKSLNILGAGLSAIVDCLYSPFVIGLSILWLGEKLTLWQVVGVVMIVSAVLTAMNENNSGPISRRDILLGFLWGATAMVANAVGIVMVKPVLDHSPLLWATELRIIGGAAMLAVILPFHPRRLVIIRSVFSVDQWKYTLSGSFLGSYLAMLLWLMGMKFTQASIAAALNQTSNIFIFIFAALLLRERITRFRLIGICLGVIGALLVSFN